MPRELVGIPSDEVRSIRAEGDGGISTLFVSMAARHPNGSDAGYLRWHTLDHRPEQHRLDAVRASLRVVSTPACRAARAANHESFAAIDHVMTYFFRDITGLGRFKKLSTALNGAARVPFVLNPVQRGVYSVTGKVAAPLVKAGCEVLPWVPMQGAYILIEPATAPAAAKTLVAVAGVAGVWSAVSVATEFSSVAAGQRLTYCYLYDDPVEVAERLQPVLRKHWEATGTEPLFAAPFHTVVPYEWERFLP